jgi:NADH-ubiquinone oxidoreductase chain 5
MTGFYSKDVILELAYSKYTVSSAFSFYLGSLTALITSLYSFRVIYLAFYTKSNKYIRVADAIHESPLCMLIPIVFLMLGSIFVGFFLKDMFIDLVQIFG